MKFEKISANKIKITLFKEDFKQWNMNLADITPESEEIKDIFLSVLKEIPKETDFETKNSQLIVEATKQEDTFIMIVSKIRIYDENDDNIYSSVFYFTDFVSLSNGCNTVEKTFFGNSSLYKADNGYYLVLGEKSKLTEILLSEYGEFIKTDNYAQDKLSETNVLMINRNAIEKIAEINGYPLKNCSI